MISAQVKSAASHTETRAASEENVLELSPFLVSDTQGKGYRAPTATSGLKSRAQIIDIPQSVMVVPRDIIDDLGQLSTVTVTYRF